MYVDDTTVLVFGNDMKIVIEGNNSKLCLLSTWPKANLVITK